LNLRKLKAGCYGTNLGSARAFEKVGFAREGCLRGQFLIAGEPVDHVLLGLLAEDFEPEARS
jgi:RimJ/RimL family protein N-acetyltransferase